MNLRARIKRLEEIIKQEEPRELTWEEGTLEWALTEKLLPEEIKAEMKEKCKTTVDVLEFITPYVWKDYEEGN